MSATATLGTPATLSPASEPAAMAASSWVRWSLIAVEIVTCGAVERSCCSYVAAVPPRIRASSTAAAAGSVTAAGTATSASTVPASATSARPGRLNDASRSPLVGSSETSVSPGVAAMSVAPEPASQRRSIAPPADPSGSSVTGAAAPVSPARRSPALTAVSRVRMSPDAVPT